MQMVFKVIQLYPDTGIQLDAWCPTLVPLALKGPLVFNKNFSFKYLTTYSHLSSKYVTTYLSSFVQIFDHVPLNFRPDI